MCVLMEIYIMDKETLGYESKKCPFVPRDKRKLFEAKSAKYYHFKNLSKRRQCCYDRKQAVAFLDVSQIALCFLSLWV